MSHSPRPGSRASQRPGSRASFRASSPSLGGVYLRNQISTVKHEIRQQTARLQTLETALQRAPRPLPQVSPDSPDQPLRRKSSLNDAGFDSYIPVPTRNRNRDSVQPQRQDIREGVPLENLTIDGVATGKRQGSPTRTLSRIPVASVGNARTLAEDGVVSPSESFIDSSLLAAPPSPGASARRSIGTSGGTSQVLADLQAKMLIARSTLDNTKSQLRQSQRAVAALTRQTEDLKEGRERHRLEIEQLNNVITRKERLLQEVLERARKAEAEATTLKTQVKTDTATTKKTIRDMEVALTEATALSQKSQSEYAAIQSAYTRLGESWRRELDGVKEDMRVREAALRKEAEDIALKYRSLVKLVQASSAERAKLEAARGDARAINEEFAASFRTELSALAQEIERSSSQSKEDTRMTLVVKDELDRILRLMHALGRASAEDEDEDDTTLDLSLL
ncbi:hypothetical protein EXIGLDRAFT_762142 [Exidia glandulosa HHB12029]|uniref:SWI5-dependent HO expression protein 3 n=1 Tax=Exidia glandulosa HHB12029 TaxID=1314781 RepID=A0A165N0T2_EXIGL|nr:hypothetical protein EXIGLDRAFT_762142 [Exidia glandulosa HHB12029]